MGTIGARTGYSCALVYRFAWGRKGTAVPNFVMAFTGMGWFGVIVNTAAGAVGDQFGVSAESGAFYVLMIVCSLLFIAPAYKSVKWIGYVNYVAVPALILVIAYVGIRTISDAGGLAGVMAIEYAPAMAVTLGFSSAAGGWLQGATVSPDFTRFCKDGKQAAWAMGLSFGVLVFLQFCAAAFGAAATGEWNIFTILTAMGVGVIAFLAVFLGAWSTGQGIVYGASLQCAAPPTPMVKNQEFTRRMWVIILWVLALIFQFAHLDSIVNWWMGLLAALVGPIAIITILDYWAFPSRQKLYESGQDPDKEVNPAALVSFVIGFCACYFSNKYGFFIPVINGMLCAGIVYYIWMKAITPKE
jgi:cytosine permease